MLSAVSNNYRARKRPSFYLYTSINISVEKEPAAKPVLGLQALFLQVLVTVLETCFGVFALHGWIDDNTEDYMAVLSFGVIIVLRNLALIILYSTYYSKVIR